MICSWAPLCLYGELCMVLKCESIFVYMVIIAYVCNMETIVGLLYRSGKTVFSIQEIRLLTRGLYPAAVLPNRLSRLVRGGDILRLRQGVYALPSYDPLEFACKIQVPSYISMETVLRMHGVIFQYDNSITLASYQPKHIFNPSGEVFLFRKLSTSILINRRGKIANPNYTIATVERAFLDLCYVDKWRTYENIDPLNVEKVLDLLPIYNNKALTERVSTILSL